MRSARRKPSRQRGGAPPPSRARRLAPRHPGLRGLDELRRTREAVTDIAGQLEALLSQLHDVGSIDAGAPDRLAGAATQATRAFTALAQLRRRLP